MRLTFFETADGSPTARIGDSEAMHSLKGAFSETVEIYGRAIEAAYDLTKPLAITPRICSMGLGLGYVEILAATLALTHGRSLSGESFESVPELISAFQTWLTAVSATDPHGSAGGSESDFVPSAIYDSILSRFAALKNQDPQKIKATLAAAVQNGDWKLLGAFTSADLNSQQPYHCVAYDAFSSKTSPELWNEDFLDLFLLRSCTSPCVLSTYACTGALKRALKRTGFTIEVKPGFASKRDSTFAIRSSLETAPMNSAE